MPGNDTVYVGHMLDTARKAVEKMERKSRADFDSDENLRLALAYLIQIIGEAASRVSLTFREAHDAIPWSEPTRSRSTAHPEPAAMLALSRASKRG